MQSGELDDLLEGLRGQGIQDSTGVFTLDLDQSRRKLRKYRFPSAWVYPQKLAQAAVQRQASWVEFDANSEVTSTQVKMAMPPLSTEEMLLACQSPLQASPHPGLFSLAMGVEAASRLGSISLAYVELHSEDRALRVFPDGTAGEPFQLPWVYDFEGLVVRVRYRWWSALPCSFLEGWHMSEIYRHSGVPIYAMGQLQNNHIRGRFQEAAPRSSQHSFTLPGLKTPECYLVAPSWTPSLIPCPAVRQGPEQTFLACQDWSAPPQVMDRPVGPAVPWLRYLGEPALGCLAYFWQTSYLAQIHWVRAGVTIQTEDMQQPRFPLGWSGAVVADGLTTDLSQCRLVKNDAYWERVDFLRAWLPALPFQGRMGPR